MKTNYIFFSAMLLLLNIGNSFSQTIAVGKLHSLSLCNDNTVRAWGKNSDGQLGNGTNIASNVPVQVNFLTGIIAISAGMYAHSLALKNDSTVWAWGFNVDGQLGNGTSGTSSNVPVQVSSLTGITAIAAGGEHSLALKDDGTIWAWGHNAAGELGNGTITSSNVPVQVTSLTGITAIAAGYTHSLALKNDGTVWAWGLNYNGQLGDGTNNNSNVPIQVGSLSGMIAIAAGDAHSLALKNDSTVWTWGDNIYGQLGDGTNTDSNVPVQVTSLTNVSHLAGGAYHSLALKNDETVWAWGRNSLGQLGNGTYTDSKTPVQISSLTGISVIAVGGGDHSLALKNDGTVWAWGSGFNGQLGNGTNSLSINPVQVTGLCNPLSIEFHSNDGEGISIYSNPATEQLSIKVGNTVTCSNYQITDLFGRIILSGKVNSAEEKIDVSSLAKDVYFFIIMQDDFIIRTEKIIIN